MGERFVTGWLGPREEATLAPARKAAWAVVVRLADGRRLFYSPRNGRQGQESWSPRESQAHRYASREDAERDAASLTTNAQAREYLVITLG